MCPYVYEHAVSPHLAAQLEGGPVCLDRVLQGYQAVCRRYDYITMEGSGGILCPLRFDGEELWLTDVIRACGLGCLLVADAGLGAINAVGLTASYLDRQGIPLKGIIFNRFQPGNRMHEDNVKLCEHLTGVRTAALVRDGDTYLDIPAERLMERFVRGDESRTTEGSGLGLSIARSLTELQGGLFRLEVDGDLFKAVVSFPVIK